jgi:succinate dehydrogenase / fumarate reductase cytochrome b subunit
MSTTLAPAAPQKRRSTSAQNKRYGFFPGCVAKESCTELYTSTLLLADKLGIELVELTAAACCGASVLNDVNRDVARVLNARTYAQAEALGLDDVITICSTCTGHMRAANKELLESEAQMEQANSILGKFGAKYAGTVTVRHLLWLLIDDIGLDELSKMVVNPLNGLKVAPFYGCHIIRPESVNGWESARNPHSLEDLIEALGGEAIDYAGKTRCCGFHVQLEKDGIAPNMVGSEHAHGQGQRRRGRADAVPALPPRARRLPGRFGRALGPHRPSDLPPPAARRAGTRRRPRGSGDETARDLARPDSPSARARADARRLAFGAPA